MNVFSNGNLNQLIAFFLLLLFPRMHWKIKREPRGEKIKLKVMAVLTKDTADWGQGERKRLLSAKEMWTINQKWMWITAFIHLHNLLQPTYISEVIHSDLNKRSKGYDTLQRALNTSSQQCFSIVLCLMRNKWDLKATWFLLPLNP